MKRVDDFAIMMIEGSFRFLHFLVNFICDYGNTQIGYVAEDPRSRATSDYRKWNVSILYAY